MPGAEGARSDEVDLPFAFVLNAPFSDVTVCAGSSRFAIDTAAPAFDGDRGELESLDLERG